MLIGLLCNVNDTSCTFHVGILQTGYAVLDKVDKLNLNRSSLRCKSSTVVHRLLFNRLTEIKFNSKAKEKSICCSLKLKLTGMEFVYFAACNFKTTDTWEYFRGCIRISEWNKGSFKKICLKKLFSSYFRYF